MKKYKLGELINVKRGMSLSGEYYAKEGNLIRLTLGNFQEECGFKINTSKDDLYFTGHVREEFILNEGDIITPLTEQVVGLLGSTARIPESGKYIQSGDVALVKCISDKIDDGYCYYLVSSDLVRRQLSAAAQQTKIRHTSPEKIMDCEVFIPEVKEQKKIAKLLDDINRKIELNNKINDNLAIAEETLYQFWFLQFDFPDANNQAYKSNGGKMVYNSHLNMYVPENWEFRSIMGMYSIERGISYTSSDIVDGTGVPMLNLACIDKNRNYRDGELKYFNSRVGDNKLTHAGDLLVACTDLTRNADIVGCPILVPDDGIQYTFSMDMARIIPDPNTFDSYYLYSALRQPFYHDYIKQYASGTNVIHLNLEGIGWYKMLIPPLNIQKQYGQMVQNMHKLRSQILVENRRLLSLRAWLLPMLMSGQATIAE